MKHPAILSALGYLLLFVLFSGCDLMASRKGSVPVIESAVLTDSNLNENSDNAYYAGETPNVVLSLSDDDENIEEIILEADFEDELKFEKTEDVSQWKDPEDYIVSLERLENDPGEWSLLVTVKDERGLTAQTSFDLTVVDLSDYLTVETPVRSTYDQEDESDSSNYLNKVYIDYTFSNPYSRQVDELRFDFYLYTTDGEEYSHKVSVSSLDESKREYFFIDSTQSVDYASIDDDSIVVKVY